MIRADAIRVAATRRCDRNSSSEGIFAQDFYSPGIVFR
jgi:hypothetical protein